MRSYFYDRDRPNQSGLPLSYPGREVLRRIPDDWTVWAFTDTHGMLGGLTASLRRAGLVDRDSHWIAAKETALVGVGDYIDRGPDSAGVVDLLSRLSAEAAAAGYGSSLSEAIMSRCCSTSCGAIPNGFGAGWRMADGPSSRATASSSHRLVHHWRHSSGATLPPCLNGSKGRCRTPFGGMSCSLTPVRSLADD